MISQYPDILPAFAATPFKYKNHNRIQRSTFASGFVRQRRTVENAPVFYSLSNVFTNAELNTFEAWRVHELKDTGWFTVKLNLPGGLIDRQVRFMTIDDEPERLSGTTWRVGFVVQARKQVVMDQLALYEKLYQVDENTGNNLLEIIQEWKG